MPGQTVRGRVVRIEAYGVFIRLGGGREGLCHISNLSVDRVAHPSEVVTRNEAVEARVLYVRAGGRRIGLGERPPACGVSEQRVRGGGYRAGRIERNPVRH